MFPLIVNKWVNGIYEMHLWHFLLSYPRNTVLSSRAFSEELKGDVQNGLAKLTARDLVPHLSEEVFSFAVILK